MAALLEHYEKKIQGVIGCYDRLLLQGTLTGLCYAKGMTSYLRQQGIRIFDYTNFANPLREMVRQNAERLSMQTGVPIEYIRKAKAVRKETLVKKRLEERGDEPGMVCILSAMESCQTYKPWHDKETHETYLKAEQGRCLHYYFYFIDKDLGLCYLRVPTWCPFRLQFYMNGHNWLASKLRKRGIGYEMLDNAFVSIEDFPVAQQLSEQFVVVALHKKLDGYVRRMCPAAAQFGVKYHWSIMQAEYATDIVFRRQKDLGPLYEHLVRTLVHAVKVEDIATFLGRKLNTNYQGEAGNDFSHRIQGTRIKHTMGRSSIKMYDKCGIVLRIETTTNDVTFFKDYREVRHKDGTRSFQLAPLRKTIYGLESTLKKLLAACNHRYLQFISQLAEPNFAVKELDKITTGITVKDRTYKGFNFFHPDDRMLFEAVLDGRYALSGMRNRDLREQLPGLSSAQISHRLKRLRVHGLLKKVGRTYKYYLTTLGRRAISTVLRLREFAILPSLTPSTVGSG